MECFAVNNLPLLYPLSIESFLISYCLYSLATVNTMLIISLNTMSLLVL